MSETLDIVIVGAHPDDCEVMAGGITARYVELGHNVRYIVTTNGDAGHYEMDRKSLKERRRQEAWDVSQVLGIQYDIMDVPDGCLEPTLKNRERLIRVLRGFQPDLIITHSLDDYHPDHRYTAQLVADTSYMLNVPLCVPDVPIVKKEVVYCYMSRISHQNTPVTMLIPVDNYMDKKRLAFHQNTSQVYEWLPWVENLDPSEIPADQKGRKEFLRKRWDPWWQELKKLYDVKIQEGVFEDVKYIEVCEASLWGSPLTPENIRRYFPFEDALILWS